ncbi:MAG: hypothetical protein M1834_009472 [Cirrosporium novae-zelandiae]|nr:MAG: hypothetical protein M1834_009472 [Cirrosporium novae-zelandiae]
MEALQREQKRVTQKANLAKSTDDVQRILDLLIKAREDIVADPNSASITLAKLQNPVKKSFETTNDDLKEVYNSLNKYSKAIDKVFKDKPLPTTEYDALSSRPYLINRAIAMHLLREGEFGVASTFLTEATPQTSMDDRTLHSLESDALRDAFSEMYQILHQLQQAHNLIPAINWARKNSQALEARGSNLEFELSQLQYVWLSKGSYRTDNMPGSSEDQQRALTYARQEFRRFANRYQREIQQLAGAMPYFSNLQQSPYKHIFLNESALEEVANAFTREYCSLLGLSADSPLHIAATAGAIALPTLLKLQTIMKQKRTEWTTQDELPVEIPLPPAYQFHAIFVCPVSKEQSTDSNPPMMMPCGHVIAQESLSRLSKGSKFKCPYCPGESRPQEAKKVVL